MKRVVYTANFGAKDTVSKVEPEEGVEYVCFTDSPNKVHNSWEKIIIPSFMGNSRKTARWLKMNSHILFRNYDYTLWIDGRIGLLHPFDYYVSLLKGNHFAVTKHPRRDCIYEEAKVCIDRKLDKEDIINNLINEYKEKKYPKNNGLCETSILLRDNSPEVNKVNKSWTSMLLYHSIRDQLSFNYILWAYNFNWSEIPYKDVRRGKHDHGK